MASTPDSFHQLEVPTLPVGPSSSVRDGLGPKTEVWEIVEFGLENPDALAERWSTCDPIHIRFNHIVI